MKYIGACSTDTNRSQANSTAKNENYRYAQYSLVNPLEVLAEAKMQVINSNNITYTEKYKKQNKTMYKI